MTARRSARVAVVTGEEEPALTDDGRALVGALRDRGMDAEPAVWTDGGIDWSSFDAALVRSCWRDYERPAAFRDWLETLDDVGTAVVNPPDAIHWNMHKFYLRDLSAAGVDVLPTAFVDSPDVGLRAVLDERGWERAVVKPAVATSSAGTFRVELEELPNHRNRFEALLADGDVLVQEFAPEIADGERSLVFLGGEYSHANVSIPVDGEFRAHPDFGGTTEPYEPSSGLVETARTVLAVARGLLGVDSTQLPYARVDGIEREGTFQLVELELIEPYLGLVRGGAVERFAAAVDRALQRNRVIRT